MRRILSTLTLTGQVLLEQASAFRWSVYSSRPIKIPNNGLRIDLTEAVHEISGISACLVETMYKVFLLHT